MSLWLCLFALTHWGWTTHMCVSKLTIIGSDNGLSPGRWQAMIWTNAGILWIDPFGINVSGISIEIHTFSFSIPNLKMSSGNWRSFCPGLTVLMIGTYPRRGPQKSFIVCFEDVLRSWMILLGESWWRHQMETFSVLLAICTGNSPVPGSCKTDVIPVR